MPRKALDFALVKSIREHLEADPKKPVDMLAIWDEHAGKWGKATDFLNEFLPALRMAARLANVKSPKVIRMNRPRPQILHTIKGTQFTWNRRGNSRYYRAGLDAQIKAHLIDNPSKPLDIQGYARYMGRPVNKPLSPVEVIHMRNVIKQIASRMAKELGTKLFRPPHGGYRVGIPAQKRQLLLGLLEGKGKVRTDAVIERFRKLTGIKITPEKIARLVEEIPLTQRPMLDHRGINLSDFANAKFREMLEAKKAKVPGRRRTI